MDQQEVSPLVRAMLNPRVYPHPVDELKLIETSSSWVILTGHYAYKIKKPIKSGLLDLSNLTRRRFYCYAELRLNQRLAPQIYFDVSSITGSPDSPQINGHGPILEFAVKMRQLPDQQLMQNLLTSGHLTPPYIARLAEMIARFHRETASAPFDTAFGHPEAVRQPMVENFATLRLLVENPDLRVRIEALERWSINQHHGLVSTMLQRKRAGYIRECHGNLLLKNMVDYENEPVAINCVEYNDNLRWIDVMNDIAYLMMDLIDHNRSDLAFHLLNAYLEQTGDYPGLNLLPYYLVFRAMMQARLAAATYQQEHLPETSRQQAHYDLLRYLSTAEQLSSPRRPVLIIMFGLPGSGKAMLAQPLVESLQGICLHSNVERKRLFGLAGPLHSESTVDSGLFTLDASRHTFERLEELSVSILRAGYPVIVNANFIKQNRRAQFQRLAKDLNIPFLIVYSNAPDQLLENRIKSRPDLIDVDLSTLHRLKAGEESLNAEELFSSITVTTDNNLDIHQFCTRVNTRLDDEFARLNQPMLAVTAPRA